MFREHLENTACSLFPQDSPPPKKIFAATLRRPCGASRFARLTCSLFPVPCSHKTPLREHVFRVPCSLSPYGKTHRWALSLLSLLGVPLMNLVPRNLRLGWLMWFVTPFPRIDGGINSHRQVSFLHGLSIEPALCKGHHFSFIKKKERNSCCFYYFVGNSLSSLLTALCARQ